MNEEERMTMCNETDRVPLFALPFIRSLFTQTACLLFFLRLGHYLISPSHCILLRRKTPTVTTVSGGKILETNESSRVESGRSGRVPGLTQIRNS